MEENQTPQVLDLSKLPDEELVTLAQTGITAVQHLIALSLQNARKCLALPSNPRKARGPENCLFRSKEKRMHELMAAGRKGVAAFNLLILRFLPLANAFIAKLAKNFELSSADRDDAQENAVFAIREAIQKFDAHKPAAWKERPFRHF